MPPAQAAVFKTRQFSHKGKSYDVSAYTKPNDADVIFVDVTQGGGPVIYTYPDKSQVTHEHSVRLMTAIDLSQRHQIDAVNYLMDDAEEQVKRWV